MRESGFSAPRMARATRAIMNARSQYEASSPAGMSRFTTNGETPFASRSTSSSAARIAALRFASTVEAPRCGIMRSAMSATDFGPSASFG